MLNPVDELAIIEINIKNYVDMTTGKSFVVKTSIIVKLYTKLVYKKISTHNCFMEIYFLLLFCNA